MPLLASSAGASFSLQWLCVTLTCVCVCAFVCGLQATIVNFAVKEKGLEAQLLGIVVKMEEPRLEERKSDLVVTVASGKRKLVELEDRILQLLSTVKGSLLDDESLVETLQASKVTAEEVTESLKIAEEVC